MNIKVAAFTVSEKSSNTIKLHDSGSGFSFSVDSGLNLLLLCLCLMCGIGWALRSSTSGVFVCLFFAYFKGGGGSLFHRIRLIELIVPLL